MLRQCDKCNRKLGALIFPTEMDMLVLLNFMKAKWRIMLYQPEPSELCSTTARAVHANIADSGYQTSPSDRDQNDDIIHWFLCHGGYFIRDITMQS